MIYALSLISLNIFDSSALCWMISVCWALMTMNVSDYWVDDNLATLVAWPFIFILIIYTNVMKYNVIKNQFPAKVRDSTPRGLFTRVRFEQKRPRKALQRLGMRSSSVPDYRKYLVWD